MAMIVMVHCLEPKGNQWRYILVDEDTVNLTSAVNIVYSESHWKHVCPEKLHTVELILWMIRDT